MKKFFVIMMMALVGLSLTGCEYDDQPLWSELEQIKNRVKVLEEAIEKANGNITAVQTIVSALEKNVYVTAVTETDNGYSIKFSDGKTAEISNGQDGVDAPVISARADEDGKYYWTLGGEWMLVDGNKVCANGEDGIAPKVRINNETKEWEVSYDNEKTWNSTGVIAEGKDGEDAAGGLEVDLSNNNYVVVTMKDGSSFKLERYDESAPVFTIKEMPQVAQIEYGKSMTFAVDAKNVAEHIISIPQCWKAIYANGTLTVTAPEKDLCHYEKEGTLAITVVSASGKVAIAKMAVAAGEWVDGIVLRTLTFEDADAKFESYVLDYADVEINTWSDLIDDPQYGGPLTYGDMYSVMYTWWDENNTDLMHIFPSSYGSYCYWTGGHAISNYKGEGYSNEDRNKHIAKYYGEDYVTEWAGNDTMLGWFNVQLMTPLGGYNGSSNFAVHYGYQDFFSMVENLPELVFADGEARVIDHMYVTNTNYTLNQLMCGVGSEAGNTFGGSYTGPSESSWFKITAYGFESVDDDDPVTELDFYLLNGTEPVLEWEKWDLTELGAVAKVRFNIFGSDDLSGSYGQTIPAYFAYDNVAVQYPGKIFK